MPYLPGHPLWRAHHLSGELKTVFYYLSCAKRAQLHLSLGGAISACRVPSRQPSCHVLLPWLSWQVPSRHGLGHRSLCSVLATLGHFSPSPRKTPHVSLKTNTAKSSVSFFSPANMWLYRNVLHVHGIFFISHASFVPQLCFTDLWWSAKTIHVPLKHLSWLMESMLGQQERAQKWKRAPLLDSYYQIGMRSRWPVPKGHRRRSHFINEPGTDSSFVHRLLPGI